MVPGGFLLFFMVSGQSLWVFKVLSLVFLGSRWLFMVFHCSRWLFYGFSWFRVCFSWFHVGFYGLLKKTQDLLQM